MAEFISTKLSYQGHLYVLHKSYRTFDDIEKKLYRCANFQKLKCGGWAHYFPHNNEVHISREHSFPCIPAPAEVEVQRFNARLRETAIFKSK